MFVSDTRRKILWVVLFAIAFGFVEASVVAYLRALDYPEGFAFPLRLAGQHHLAIELFREGATIIMLLSVAVLAGGKLWDRFAYFSIAFGVWDIMYYIWLKAIVNWPGSLLDWDVLFLIPLPWIAPVIAPALISLLMILLGAGVLYRLDNGRRFRPELLSWLTALVATMIVLISFMSDTDASLHGQLPRPYRFTALGAGVLLYVVSFGLACWPAKFPRRRKHDRA